MNPVEEYLADKEETEKTAGPLQGFSRYFRSSGLGSDLARMTVGAGVLAVPAAASKVYTAITKGRDFRAMMQNNQDLHEMQQELGAPRFHALYSSLRSMNPEFSADPIVAGTYMRQMARHPEQAGKTIVESLGSRRGMQESPLQFQSVGLPGGPKWPED